MPRMNKEAITKSKPLNIGMKVLETGTLLLTVAAATAIILGANILLLGLPLMFIAAPARVLVSTYKLVKNPELLVGAFKTLRNKLPGHKPLPVQMSLFPLKDVQGSRFSPKNIKLRFNRLSNQLKKNAGQGCTQPLFETRRDVMRP